jgi:predicted DCC family thiol-disulfide oxidoreductase YuxK
MKTLNNHLILYDGECPMCKLYTGAFQKSGMLDAHGRAAYQDTPDNVCPVIDRQRAVNEIALVNKQTGEVTYGVTSLFKVIENSFPVFKPLFSFKPFVWLSKKAYSFISYNRRVIAISAHADDFEIQPTFRLNLRLAYLAVTWLLVSVILTAYTQLLSGVLPLGNSHREYLICGGQLVFQGLIISVYAPQKRWDYLGNMMTISMAGALLLLPALITARFFTLAPTVYAAYFMAVAGLMFVEHVRRTKILQLGGLLTISWALYRIIVLVLILKIK